jgi:DNA-binding MarR family transcriptional regulator
MEKRMSMTVALEDLALGEVTLEEGAKTVRAVLAKLDDEAAHELYEALRSWLWKTLEARRRDEELSGWMDVFTRASARVAERSRDLAIKLEAFTELLHASIMTAGAAEQRDPLERKHVKTALRTIYLSRGRLQRKQLMDILKLKAANLSRVMTPLLDDGLIMREVDGREIYYRLTMKGTEATLPLVAHESRGLAPAALSGPEKRVIPALGLPVIKKMPTWAWEAPDDIYNIYKCVMVITSDNDCVIESTGYTGGTPRMYDEGRDSEVFYERAAR